MPTGQNLALVNGRIHTLDPEKTVAQALGISRGVIEVIGSTAEVEAWLRRQGGERVDLGGAAVVPGFTDAHVHLMVTGLNLFAVDLSQARTVQEVLELVSQRAGEMPPGEWVHGKALDEAALREERPPTRWELDRVAPDNPVFLLDRGMHYHLVNSRGVEKLGLTGEERGVEVEAGACTGRIQQRGTGGTHQVFYESLGEDLKARAVWEVARLAAARGATSIHAIDGGPLFSDSDVPVITRLQPELPVRVELFWNTPEVQRVAAGGYQRAGGCILLDGSVGSRTAAFSEPYADADTSGGLNFTHPQVLEIMEGAQQSGLQVSFHCIGDRAIRLALECYRELFSKYPEAARANHRLEHFGFPSRRDLDQAAELGIWISTQPAFAYLRGGEGGVYQRRLGTGRALAGYPMRSLLDAGNRVVGGSDADATPLDPLLGVHAAMNHPNPAEQVNLGEALEMFTSQGPASIGRGNELGTLEPGKKADLAVLESDPGETDRGEIKDIGVLATYVEGERVFSVDAPG